MDQNAQTPSDGRGTPIKLWVPGTPRAWPRPIPLVKRMRGAVQCSSSRGCRVDILPGSSDRDWRKAIRTRAGFLVGANGPWFDDGDPLILAARFFFLRPKSHHVAGDRDRSLKANAPEPGDFAQKPDIDNLAKSVSDALQAVSGYPSGLLYRDDQQVSVIVARKLWADPKTGPGLSLIVCRVDDALGDVVGWLMS